MWPIYLRLFNIILDTAIVPDNWTPGLIEPIYKQKGNKEEPSNYRPITLVSCIGKYFTTILCARLNKFAESKDLINSIPIGFRKAFIPLDNIKWEMRSFKSNENIHKKEGGSYYVVSANKASSVTPQLWEFQIGSLFKDWYKSKWGPNK